MNFFQKLFKSIFGGLFGLSSQPKIVIPPAPPPTPAPTQEESAKPVVTGRTALDVIRRTRLGRRRFVTNASLGIPAIAGAGLGIPGAQQ